VPHAVRHKRALKKLAFINYAEITSTGMGGGGAHFFLACRAVCFAVKIYCLHPLAVKSVMPYPLWLLLFLNTNIVVLLTSVGKKELLCDF